jgi:uncharacterized protein
MIVRTIATLILLGVAAPAWPQSFDCAKACPQADQMQWIKSTRDVYQDAACLKTT